MAVIKIVPMPGAVGDKGDEGAPGARGPQGEQGLQGAPGTNAVWSYQGAWNSASAYAVGDVVVYQGQLYYTKSVTTSGTLPTVTAKFDLIASKGADGQAGTNGTNGTNGLQGVPGTNGTNGTNGADGLDGAPGNNGADALWNYVGEYGGGTSYAVGDVVTFDGQLWYRYNANGGNVGDTPSPGLWNLLAAKGADGSGNADIADFVFTDNYNGTGKSGITLPGDKGIVIAAGEESDLYLTAGDDLYIQTLGEGDDIHLNAADDIRFTTGNENIEFATPPYWRMNSEGRFVLPGEGYITNPINSSGDGSGLSTINLFPDGNIASDQYVIIDPTSPNHIHLRAGGVQDNSNAHIFLGGEKNNIEVSDPYRTVKVNTKPDNTENIYANSNGTSNTEFVHASTADIQGGDTVRLYTGGPTYVVDNVTQEYPYAGAITVTAPGLSFITGEAYVFTREPLYNNQWTFGNDGVLSGPAMGAVRVNSLLGNSEDTLVIANSTKLVLDGGLGEFLNDESANNQIATIGDLPTGATGTFMSQDNKTVTVTNGIITSIV